MFCKNCGAQIEDGTSFCPSCGGKVEAAAPEAPAYQPVQAPVSQQPANYAQLKTNKSLLKFILLSIITCGIYSIVFYSSLSENINTIASRYDGKKTMHYCLLFFLIGPITLEIGTIVWFHKISNRIGMELARRGIAYNFSASTFWLWNVLGSLIVVGPFIYLHKLCKAANLLAEDYNQKG